jgi:hypothetical protein
LHVIIEANRAYSNNYDNPYHAKHYNDPKNSVGYSNEYLPHRRTYAQDQSVELQISSSPTYQSSPGSVIQRMTANNIMYNIKNSDINPTVPQYDGTANNGKIVVLDDWLNYTIQEQYKLILVDENPVHFPHYIEKSDTIQQNDCAVKETLLLLHQIIIEMQQNDNQSNNNNNNRNERSNEEDDDDWEQKSNSEDDEQDEIHPFNTNTNTSMLITY